MSGLNLNDQTKRDIPFIACKLSNSNLILDPMLREQVSSLIYRTGSYYCLFYVMYMTFKDLSRAVEQRA